MTLQRIFVDANVINDIYHSARPLHTDSRSCLTYCLENDVQLVTSCDIVTTVYYITAKYTSRDKTLSALHEVNQMFELVPFDNRLLDVAIKLMQRDADYCDLEGTLQYCMAQAAGCELILSNDAGFVAKELLTYTTPDFLDHIHSET